MSFVSMSQSIKYHLTLEIHVDKNLNENKLGWKLYDVDQRYQDASASLAVVNPGFGKRALRIDADFWAKSEEEALAALDDYLQLLLLHKKGIRSLKLVNFRSLVYSNDRIYSIILATIYLYFLVVLILKHGRHFFRHIRSEAYEYQGNT